MTSQSQFVDVPVCLQWVGGPAGHLRLLDQTLLPSQVRWIECHSVDAVWEAIKKLRVRGAPAIGIAAAYGVVLAGGQGRSSEPLAIAVQSAIRHLATSRPTAINLFWALRRMEQVMSRSEPIAQDLQAALLTEAQAIEAEDRQMCRAIGLHGADLIPDGATLLTHCNAGGLATAQYGTALSVMYACQDQGKRIQVYADETRPLWQGARLTAWELQRHQIPTTIICDSMAAHVMQTRRVDAVLVGADRITRRGDVANKIGTYAVAVAARYHQVPFYVAAPSSTFDLELTDGRDIPIEHRDAAEVIRPYGLRLAPEGVQVYNPAFDVTPAELITAIITERGVIRPVNENSILELLA
ncbi:MAG: S-methyl-5-thioribose-1-phosphate isomerase [Pirellulaceae bacterium]|nr:S-methyl-5-thioribose-1-phosphate isomerase [Pirellulaceae bacterium]